jgi:hypothetical protein
MLLAAMAAVKKTLLFTLLLAGGLCVAQAQSYSIDWFKVAGGGGTSTGSTYQVSGTIGQHDAGEPMTGGTYSQYSLTGGFWSIYALQTPGAPTLTVALGDPHSVVVSWSLTATNFVLVQNSDLTVTNGWIPSVYPITTDGDVESITITSPPPGNLFFRLMKN